MQNLTRSQKALISYKIRNNISGDIMLGTSDIDHIIRNENLPNPSQRRNKIIQYIGDDVSRSGENISDIPIEFYTYVGAPSYASAAEMMMELKNENIIKGISMPTPAGILWFDVNLKFDGWELYEKEQRKK